MGNFMQRLMGLKLNDDDKRVGVVALDVYEVLLAESQSVKYPAEGRPPMSPALSIFAIEIIPHKRMPEGDMLLIPSDIDPDVAVEMYLIEKSRK